MRRVIALIAVICLLLTACGKSDTPNKKKKVPSEKPSQSSEIKSNSSSDNDEYEELSKPEDSELSFGGILTGTVKSTVASSDGIEKPVSVFRDTQSGGYDKEAKKLRDTIINSKNGSYNVTGTTYYISPNGDDFNSGTSPDDAWQTLDALLINNYMIEKGDAILFERGGVFRANTSIIISTSGIILGAYGEGPKPCIYGSPIDYANDEIWESSNKRNVWKMEFPLRDAGIMVFNNGEFAGIKRSGLASMKQNGDFYHNTDEKMLYVYCDKGNPGNAWNNIEIGTDQFLVSIYGGVSDILIDNLCFKYTGAHGIDAFEDNHDITISNCEFGWIGGSIQSGVTRYGNAIQFWDSCWDIEVKNNWIYQVYDAGLTFQFAIEAEGGGQYHDISFSDNLIEYCTYSIEIFTSRYDGTLKNINIDSNVMRFAGYGFGSQRPNSLNVSHICGWNVNYGSAVENLIIKNNIFDCSTTQAVDWASGDKPHVGFKVSGNTFYQKAYKNNPVMNFGVDGYKYALNQSELEAAVATFDSSPKLVKWIK